VLGAFTKYKTSGQKQNTCCTSTLANINWQLGREKGQHLATGPFKDSNTDKTSLSTIWQEKHKIRIAPLQQ
jgi:hypothetical protein